MMSDYLCNSRVCCRVRVTRQVEFTRRVWVWNYFPTRVHLRVTRRVKFSPNRYGRVGTTHRVCTCCHLYACSSSAPTPVKPQPTPAILSQESVHTTLSITHHTRKRPSTGPRTTHGPQKVMEVGSSIREVFIVMKMLET
jgi:hypothetical protein